MLSSQEVSRYGLFILVLVLSYFITARVFGSTSFIFLPGWHGFLSSAFFIWLNYVGFRLLAAIYSKGG